MAARIPSHDDSDEEMQIPLTNLGREAPGGFRARPVPNRASTFPRLPEINPNLNQTIPVRGRPDDSLRANLLITRRLLWPWIWTVVSSIVIVIITKVYESRGVIRPAGKHIFNTISTAFILLLGLSFFEAFKELGKALPRHINAWFDPPDKARRLVAGFDSLLAVLRLTCLDASLTCGFRLFSLSWLILNLVAQVAAALISLTATVDDGQNYNSTYIHKGVVQSSNLTCFQQFRGHCPEPVTAHALAHTYGETILAQDCGSYAHLSTSKKPDEDYGYYCKNQPGIDDANIQDVGQEFAYRFKDYNPDDKQRMFPQFTGRIVKVSSGECRQYPVLGEPAMDQIGNLNALNHTYQNGSANGTITIPVSYLGENGTTYIIRDVQGLARFNGFQCGERCLLVWAYKNPGSSEHRMFYECPITVSPVDNAKLRPEHEIPDEVARVAAASIALQGRQNDSEDREYRQQFQFYATGHPWELHNHNASKAGANMAQSAIDALAGMIAQNEQIRFPGNVPRLGSKVSVTWRFFIPLMACIIGAHTLIVILNFLALRYEPKSSLDKGRLL